MSDDARPPLVSVASQLPPLASEFGTAAPESDMYAIACRCAVARGISVVAHPLCQHTVRQFRMEELLNLRAEGESPNVGEEKEGKE